MVIRDVAGLDEIREVMRHERETWGLADADTLPLPMLVATQAAGAMLVGAFDGSRLVGFVYAFPGLEHGRTTFHSHMLAVSPEYRDRELGFRLKLAQRERALVVGVREITWTFDPLQSRNAYFNFSKLGVVSDSYRVDFYGGGSSSFLFRGGTDRLWVRWLLESDRVRARVEASPAAPSVEPPAGAVRLVRVGGDGWPEESRPQGALSAEALLVEIPLEINEIWRTSPELGEAWRAVSRRALVEALDAGFFVDAFLRDARRGGSYLLRRGAPVSS